MKRLFLSVVLSSLVSIGLNSRTQVLDSNKNNITRCYITPGRSRVGGESACCTKLRICVEHTVRSYEERQCGVDHTCGHSAIIKEQKTDSNSSAEFRIKTLENHNLTEMWAYVSDLRNVSSEDLRIWVCLTNRGVKSCVCLQPSTSDSCGIFEVPRWWLRVNMKGIESGDCLELSIEVRRSCSCDEDSKLSQTVNIALVSVLMSQLNHTCVQNKLKNIGSCRTQRRLLVSEIDDILSDILRENCVLSHNTTIC